MRAGNLRQRVVLYDLVETRDALGGVTTGWGNERYRWASADMVSAREYLAGQGVVEEGTVKFTIRYESTFSQTSKVVWDGVSYFVTQVRDVEGKKRTLEILAARKSPQ